MSAQSILPTLLRGFFEEYLVAQRDVSVNTIHAYRDSIKLLLRFAARRTGRQVIRLRVDDLGVETVLAVLTYLEAERKNCVATRNCRLIAVHRFFAYVADVDPQHAELCRRVLDIPVKKTVAAARGVAPRRAAGFRSRSRWTRRPQPPKSSRRSRREEPPRVGRFQQAHRVLESHS